VNILNNYAISPKADGERNFLYVDPDNKLYLINNSFDIRYTGYKSKDNQNTLVEGEYISTDNLFLGYDILFYKNKDLRNLSLYSKNIKKKLDLGF